MDLYCTNCDVKWNSLVANQFCSLQHDPMRICLRVCMSVHHSQSFQLLSAILNQFDVTHNTHMCAHASTHSLTHALTNHLITHIASSKYLVRSQ